MATVYAGLATNLDTITLNTVLAETTSLEFLDDVNYQSPLANTYQDVVKVGFDDSGVASFAYFAGAGITVAFPPSITGGTIGGYFQTADEGAGFVTAWGVEGFSYSAVSMYQASLTSDTSDEMAILVAILGGNDTFNLSPYADVASGYTGNDAMFGMAGTDKLAGGDGTDTLDGGTGVDTLLGGAGNDTYVVTAGDVITELAGAGIDTVKSGSSWTLAANVEKLILTGGAAINGIGNGDANTLTGNTGANTLNGLGGADTLLGQGGSDVLKGGAGRDVLTGGGGNDAFVFDTVLSAATNVDTIKDFAAGADKLRLDDDVFKALSAGVALTDAQFAAGAGLSSAQTADEHIIYDTTTGALYYDADGLGGAALAVKFAVLGVTTHPTISVADFVIVA